MISWWKAWTRRQRRKRTEKRRRIAAVQTNANRANDARANIDVCVCKHKPADVTRGGADAFSNMFEHGDTYEGGQVEYELE